jgi:ABC-type multidrug transport system permease subunit
VSAAKVVSVLHSLAHDPDNPTAVIATIHQPSSQIYRIFDRVVLLSGGRALYEGLGGYAPADYFAQQGSPCAPGYNVADHLLDLAHDLPAQRDSTSASHNKEYATSTTTVHGSTYKKLAKPSTAAAFLTQLQVLAGREWKVLRRFVGIHFARSDAVLRGWSDHLLIVELRDRTFFLAHVALSAMLGVFVGGLYWHTNLTIAGFQSRIGCLFFLVRPQPSNKCSF